MLIKYPTLATAQQKIVRYKCVSEVFAVPKAFGMVCAGRASLVWFTSYNFAAGLQVTSYNARDGSRDHRSPQNGMLRTARKMTEKTRSAVKSVWNQSLIIHHYGVFSYDIW